jgi:hypothetical protein
VNCTMTDNGSQRVNVSSVLQGWFLYQSVQIYQMLILIDWFFWKNGNLRETGRLVLLKPIGQHFCFQLRTF